MRIEGGARRVATICDAIKHAVSLACIVGCLATIGWTVVEVSRAAPGSIRALAVFVRDWKLTEIVLVLGNVAWYGLYRKERRGKKRAIVRKSEYQKIAEASDPQRSTSGLTSTGDTPKGAIT